MAIIRAAIVGYEVDYWSASVPFESDAEVQKYIHEEDVYWASRENIRRITAKFSRLPPFYYLMHWNQCTQPVGLDAKVADGSVREEDFAGAVLAEPVGYRCRFCDAHLRAAVVDRGNPILGKHLPARLRAHEFVQECPICHHEIARNVVEFIPSDAGSPRSPSAS